MTLWQELSVLPWWFLPVIVGATVGWALLLHYVILKKL
jgi:hypothetical protein